MAANRRASTVQGLDESRVTTKKKAHVEPQDMCRLFQLPRELRDVIYEYALTEEVDAEVEITSKLKPPSLLSVCHQIRDEALELWYTCNDFLVTINDCNAGLLRASQRHMLRRGVCAHAEQNVFIVCEGAQWASLMQWSRWVFDGETIPLERDNDLERDEFVICAALEIAREMETWEQCEKALKSLRYAVSGLDPVWA